MLAEGAHSFTNDWLIGLFNGLEHAPNDQQLKARRLVGTRAGETVKALWGLIGGDTPHSASWDAAILVVENEAVSAGHRTGRSTLRGDLSTMRAVLHLWGALALRGRRLLADANVGYSLLDDLRALMQEALILRRELCRWNVRRGRRDDELLQGDFFRTVAWLVPA